VIMKDNFEQGLIRGQDQIYKGLVVINFYLPVMIFDSKTPVQAIIYVFHAIALLTG
jgi:hypothetical protein